MLLWPAFAALRRGKPRSLECGNFRPFFLANQLIQRFAKGWKDNKEICDGNPYFQAGFSQRMFVLALPT
jgi:hypothetical protein